MDKGYRRVVDGGHPDADDEAVDQIGEMPTSFNRRRRRVRFAPHFDSTPPRGTTHCFHLPHSGTHPSRSCLWRKKRIAEVSAIVGRWSNRRRRMLMRQFRRIFWMVYRWRATAMGNWDDA